jgi:thiamine biosynthesis lipoprotein
LPEAQRTEYALGTVCKIKLYDFPEKSGEAVLDKAFGLISDIEWLTSSGIKGNPLDSINSGAFGNDVKVENPELFRLIETGLSFSKATGGAFDVTLGKLSELWGIGTEHARVPPQTEIDAVINNTGYELVSLDEAKKTIRFSGAGVKIDLGGIAKGYAADKVTGLLREEGVTSAIVDLGGDVSVIGLNQGKAWRVGITDPLNVNSMKLVTEQTDAKIVTSGNYQRFFIKDGKRYHHIFDRKTGRPSESGIISVTVISKDGTMADAYSTAVLVGGEKIVPESLKGSVIAIDKNENILYY